MQINVRATVSVFVIRIGIDVAPCSLFSFMLGGPGVACLLDSDDSIIERRETPPERGIMVPALSESLSSLFFFVGKLSLRSKATTLAGFWPYVPWAFSPVHPESVTSLHWFGGPHSQKVL